MSHPDPASASGARSDPQRPVDLFVIGGGVNGCGIARDAAGRGLSVMLAEMGDLGGATSSASTKLFHGGLRYLEYLEIRLVREALREREILLAAMPHIARPMRFVIPYHGGMRFDTDTPVSRLLGGAFPWLRGRRPGWMIRLGLFLYDHLAGRSILPGARALDLTADPAGAPLRPVFRKGFEYSDCQVDDARLVVLNARDAHMRGAAILTRHRVEEARRADGLWQITLRDLAGDATRRVRARALVNAAGPWADRLARRNLHSPTRGRLRLDRGSHIVVPRLFGHGRAYFLQGGDGRIVFAIPYEDDFTLIGTTDRDHPDPDTPARCTDEEVAYLCDFVSGFFRRPVTPADVVWRFAGVRALYDDGAPSAKAATREYVLELDTRDGAPLLNVLGGKITTYRRLAEAALDRLAPVLGGMGRPWTARAPLPGGDFALDALPGLIRDLQARHPFLGAATATRLVRAYGTEAASLLGNARSPADLGRDFGAGLTEAELHWMIRHEFARTAEDVLWRRSKLGLRLDPDAARAVAAWMERNAKDGTSEGTREGT